MVGVKTGRAIVAASMMSGALRLGAPGVAEAEDFFGADFEAFSGLSRESVHAIPEWELDMIRGRYLGFYFSVTFSGVIEVGGAVNGSLDVKAGLGGDGGGLTFTPGDASGGSPGSPGSANPSVTVTDGVTGESFRVQAGIGGGAFEGSRGVFQISQVPGNGNDIRQALTINLAVIQTPETDVDRIRAQLGPLFGL